MRRRGAARVAAGLLALGWGFFFFGLIDLAVVFERTPDFYPSYLLETGWGLLYTVLVAVPLVGLAVRPGRRSLLVQLFAVGLCVLLSGLAASSWYQLWPAAGLLLTAVLLAWLGRDSGQGTPGHGLSWRGGVLRRPLLLAACVAAPACAWVAVRLDSGFRRGLPPTDDDTWFVDHWPMQAALALAVPAVTVLASLALPGWRTSLWTAVVTAAWWGAVSVSYPDHAGSLGAAGGWTAIGWSLLALGCATDRRPRARVPDA